VSTAIEDTVPEVVKPVNSKIPIIKRNGVTLIATTKGPKWEHIDASTGGMLYQI
jgi:hypothetical protein